MAEALQYADGASFVAHSGSAESPPSETNPPPVFLPVHTSHRIARDTEQDNSELKAYKLGKKRWLYNECRISLLPESGFYPPLEVAEACRQGDDNIPEQFQDCGVAYSLKLKGSNGPKLDLEAYVVFDAPQPLGLQEQQAGPLGAAGYKWPPVHRSDCQKGCDGPILRSIQRYGRISRRTGKKQSPEVHEDRAKDPRFLYLSIDEASTHVGSKRFRLVAAVYDAATRELLGTCCSLPIQVLANNDAPNGPATIDLDITISGGWAGWDAAAEAAAGDAADARNTSAESLQREHYPLDVAEPSSSVQIGSSWYPGALQPQDSRAKIDLQYIRERALLSTDEDDGSLSFDDALRAPKRLKSAYGLDADVPISSFYHRMDSAGAQLTSSGFSSMSTYLTPERLRLEPAAEHSSLDSAALSLQELDTPAMRHASLPAPASAIAARHNSLPTSFPDLSIMRQGPGPRALRDVALRQHAAGARGHVRYNSAPFHGGLLSELQSQRSGRLDSRDNLFWSSLSNPQALSAQASMARQVSSPASLLHSEADGWPWPAGGRGRVQEAQNPRLSGGVPSQLVNPFAQHGDSTDDEFWSHQAQLELSGRRNSGREDKAS